MQTRIVTFQVLSERRFSMVDQVDFANLSGDINSAHIDARRMQFGLPIVHGLHAVLWVLESFLRAKSLQPRPSRSLQQQRKKQHSKEVLWKQRKLVRRSIRDTAGACARGC